MSKSMFDIGRSGSQTEITEALASTTTAYTGVHRDLVKGAAAALVEDGKPENLQQILAQTYVSFDKSVSARALADAIARSENDSVMSAAHIDLALEDFKKSPKARQDILERTALSAVEKKLFVEPETDEANTIGVLSSLKGAGLDFGFHNNILLQNAFKKSTGAVVGFIANNGGDLEAAAADAARSNDMQTFQGLKNYKMTLRLSFLEAQYKDLEDQYREKVGHAPEPFPREKKLFPGTQI